MNGRRSGAILALVVLLLGMAAVAAACSDRERPDDHVATQTQTQPPAPTPAPSPTPVPLTVTLDVPAFADQGYPVTIRAFVRRLELPVAAELTVSLGDGTEEVAVSGGGGSVEIEHVYLAAGRHEVRIRATAPGFAAGQTTTVVDVRPRQLVFVQGMNSASRCPDGQGFTTRAPEWLSTYLFEAENLAGLAVNPESLRYFSYSGNWCAGGIAADYSASDTCAGIADRLAPRLKAFIDSLPEGKVTVVAHSMGGLVTAYLVASEPDWAAERIASVATFDSPLGGINLVRAGFLGAGGIFDGDCGLSSDAVHDLRDDSDVTRIARDAGAIVPFYTSDATDQEGPVFARIEAVPGGMTRLDGERLHVTFGDKHSESWTRTGDHVALKRAFVGCALTLASADCIEGDAR